MLKFIYYEKATKFHGLLRIYELYPQGCQGVGTMAPPDFGRTVNPTYLNQEGYIIPITLLLAPLDFQTFLGPCKKQKIAYLGDGQDYLFNKDFIPFISYWYCLQLKVSKFQNEFMKLSFHPKYEPKIVNIPEQKSLQSLVHILGETMTS